MKRLGKMLLALVVSVVFASQPLVLACEEGNIIGSEAAPLAVGKDAPNVFWTIESGNISIYTADLSRELLRQIPYDADYLPLHDRDRVIPEDMNFDGYADLKIMASRGLANVYYACWLWDQAKQNFVLHEELSQLSSPRFDAGTKTISSFNRSSATDSTETTYTFRNGKLRPLNIIEQAYDPAINVVIARVYSVDAQGVRQLACAQIVPQDQDADESFYSDRGPLPNATPYRSQHGFSLLLPEGATAEDTAWGAKIKADKWFVLISRSGAAIDNLADINVRAGLEKKAFSEAPLAGNRLEWAYSTDKATLGGYEFYRRPFTGTVDGVAVARGVFYYGNINGRHFRVVNVQLPGISDGIILLYKTLDTLVVE
jgi:hypothetical protein